ncbi:MAG TPA: hypothetical protein VMY42_17095 [Thermoguttaceae bacterium]|nr:hypothetical protein [Thermoguttaceae bacterium]
MRSFHPYLLAAFVVASLYAANFRATPPGDVLLPLLVLVASAGVAVWALGWIYRTRPRGAIAASWLIGLCFSYFYLCTIVESVCASLDSDFGSIRHRYTQGAWFLVTSIGLVWIHRAGFDVRKATRRLNYAAAMLLCASLLTVAFDLARGCFETATTDRNVETPPAAEIALRRPARPRDVYYLVFDRYADNQTLREEFGHDNGEFCDRLRQRGFYVPAESRANYPKTEIAMSCALNMQYHGDVVLDYGQYARQLQDHRVCTMLKQQGYKFYQLGNWCDFLRSNRNADFSDSFTLAPSEFAQALYRCTPLSAWWPIRQTRGQVLRKIETLKGIASEAGSKFVYAHFLLPHPPYIFHRDGSGVSTLGRMGQDKHESYINQLIFTNDRILEIVDAILAASEVAPIIVIQADEGPYLSAADKQKSPPAWMRKRTGIFSAFYLPGVDAAETVPPTISPVNTFRLIFKEYFDADLDLLADRVYYWENPTADGVGTSSLKEGTRLVEVTEEVRGNAALAGRATVVR